MPRKRFVLALLLSVVVSACGPVGPKRLACSIDSSASALRPGALVLLRGLPDGAAVVEAWYGDSELIVTVGEEGEVAVLAPFYSDTDLFASGAVEISLKVDGQPCGSLAVHVAGLPDPTDPTVRGGFERMVTEYVANLDTILDDSDLDRHDLMTVDESGVLEYGLLFMLDYLVRGVDNPNSLVNMQASGVVMIDGELVPIDWNVVDGLLAWRTGAPAMDVGQITAATFPAPNIRVESRTPAGLFELMARQHKAEHTLLPAVEVSLAGVGAIGAVASLFPPPANVVATAAVIVEIAGTITQWAIVAREVHLLPNEVTLEFDVGDPLLDEDGTGQWSNLVLQPSNQGAYDTTESLISLALSGVGLASTAKGVRAAVTTLVTTVLGKANEIARWDSSQPSPYQWDPVSIPTAEAAKWVVPHDDSGITQLNDNLGSYEAMTVGVGAVGLAVRTDLVQNRLFSNKVAVEVLPIEVRLEPGEPPDIHPGETACFVAVVENATDAAVTWTIDDSPWSDDSGCWTAPEAQMLADECSDGMHAVRIGVKSTSQSGARQAKYDPPERSAEAVLNVVCDQAIHFQGEFSVEGYVYESDPDKCQLPIELRVWGTIALEASSDGTSLLNVTRGGTSFGPTCFSYFHPAGNWSPQRLYVTVSDEGVSLSAHYSDDGGQWMFSAAGPLPGPLTGTFQHDYWFGGLTGTISGVVDLYRQP